MHNLVRALTPGLLIFGMGILHGQTTLQSWTAAPGQVFFGRSVADLGDVDGDGVSDVAVGDGFGAQYVGSVHVFSGKTGMPLYELSGSTPGETFGEAVVSCGDVNGDHVPDFAVGAPLNSAAGSGAGQVTVRSGVDGSILSTWNGSEPGAGFGQTLANLGDLNGDGLDELAVGAPRQGADQRGAVWIYDAGGFAGQIALPTLSGDGPGDALGSAVARAGDVDGDGTPDFVLGAPQTASANGYVRVHSGADGALLWKAVGDNKGDGFGTAVGGVTDVDGDGQADVIVGIPGLDAGWVDGGGVALYSGATGVLTALYAGNANGCRLGFSVVGLDDQDSDGVGEIAAGTDKVLGNEVRVWSGSSGALLMTIPVFDESAAGLGSGVELAQCDDLNGDGWAELLIGVPTRWISPDPGHALVISLQAIPWVDLGYAFPGSLGLPQLGGVGSLEAGSGFVLTVSNGLPYGWASLVTGLSQVNASFKGGVLVPAPDIISPGAALDVQGSLSLGGSLPAEVAAGTQVFYQIWIEDPGAAQGLAGSNALEATVP